MKNLVVISLDCVRRESVGCYRMPFQTYLHREITPFIFPGMRRLKGLYEPVVNLLLKPFLTPETPHIDSLAADGVIFTEAVSHAPYTPASHASLFTGLNPFSHGIRRFVGYRLSQRALTIAERLKSADFATGGFIAANALGEFYGLQRGFDVYDFNSEESVCEVGDLEIYRRNHREVTNKALNWLAGVNKRFFLFVHYFDVHETQNSSFSYQPFYQIVKMKQIDNSIGRIINFLKERQMYEDTVFVVASDHGNDFGIHEPGHREYLYDTTLLVPLVIKGNGPVKGQEISCQVRLIDIFPTVMELLDLPAANPEGFNRVEGKSLVPLCSGVECEERSAFSETYIERSKEEWDIPQGSLMSLRYSDWKLVVDRITGELQLFDLRQDPQESADIYPSQKKQGDLLKQELDALIASSQGTEDEMTESEILSVKESLKTLGYL